MLISIYIEQLLNTITLQLQKKALPEKPMSPSKFKNKIKKLDTKFGHFIKYDKEYHQIS